MAERIARLVTVHGRVQGVNFRDATRRAALAAGVDGWVRNQPDGTVQAHLEGPPDAVGRVVAFLRSGPPHAQVEHTEVADTPPDDRPGFQIR